MKSRMVLSGMLVLALAAGNVWSQSKPKLVAKAKEAVAESVRDAWLGQICLDELGKGSSAATYERAAGIAHMAILARLQCGRIDQLDGLAELVFVLRASKYLPLIEQVTEDKKLGTWLTANPSVARPFFRALAGMVTPQNAFTRLGELVEAEEQGVLAYPELAVAFATTQPLPFAQGQPSPASTAESFHWFAANESKVKFRHDLKKLPFEVLGYLANTRLSIAERRWAASRYQATRDPRQLHGLIRIDKNPYKGRAKAITNRPYSLMNILKFGGDAGERGYFASQICKTLGMPAATVFGRASGGYGRLWMTYLKPAPPGGRMVWDNQIGRDANVLTGEVYAPLTTRPVPESDLQLAGLAAQLPLADRRASDAAVAMARIVNAAQKQTDAVKLDILRNLAKAYDQRLADTDSDKSDTTWIRQSRKLNGALAAELLGVAIARNPGNRSAWNVIAELAGGNRLPTESVREFLTILIEKIATPFPDCSCELLLGIVPALPTPAERAKIYQKAGPRYRTRPDLRGRLVIAVGDDYRTQNKPDLALRMYEQAANSNIGTVDVLVLATSKAEALLVGANRADVAIRMYHKLFTRTKRVRPAAPKGSSRYELGIRLMSLLVNAGQGAAAEKIKREI